MGLAPPRTVHSFYFHYCRREQPTVVWCLLPEEHYIAFISIIAVGRGLAPAENKREKKITICGYSLPFICKRLLLPAGASPRPTETVIFIFCGSSYGNSAKRPLAARPTEIRKNIGNVVFLGKQVLPAEASAIQPQVISGGQLLEAFSLGEGGERPRPCG